MPHNNNQTQNFPVSMAQDPSKSELSDRQKLQQLDEPIPQNELTGYYDLMGLTSQTHLVERLGVQVFKSRQPTPDELNLLTKSLVRPLMHFEITSDVSASHPYGIVVEINQQLTVDLSEPDLDAEVNSAHDEAAEAWEISRTSETVLPVYANSNSSDIVNEFVVNSVDALKSIHIPQLAYTSFLRAKSDPAIERFAECLIKAIDSHNLSDLQLANIPQRTVKSDCLISISEEQAKRISGIASIGHGVDNFHPHCLFRGKFIDERGKVSSIRPCFKVMGKSQVYILLFIDFHHLAFAEWLNSRKSNNYENLKDNEFCFLHDVLLEKLTFDLHDSLSTMSKLAPVSKANI